MNDMKRPVLAADDRHRTFDEPRIVDHLLLYGWSRRAHPGAVEPQRADVCAALERWIALGLPFAKRSDGVRCYDPAEVVDVMKWSGAQHADPFWRERFIGNARRLVEDWLPDRGDTGAPDVARLGTRRFEIALRREFNLQYLQPGSKPMLRLPLPIESETLQDLSIAYRAATDPDVGFSVAPGRLDVRLTATNRPGCSIELDAAFNLSTRARNDGAPLAPADAELYTRATEGYVRLTPRVVALAERLAGTRRETRDIVHAFWDFLIDELASGFVDHASIDVARPLDDVLDHGWFDCHLGSALLVALCRARGIPARLLSGYLLYPENPSYHSWAEVWMQGRGWEPFDSFAADLSAQGRDAAWRDCFFGKLDYRMPYECLPRIFQRSPGLRVPSTWRLLARAVGVATQVGLYDAANGAPIYVDRIVVRASSPAGVEGTAFADEDSPFEDPVS